MAKRPFVAGNWKMHGTRAELGNITHVSIETETIDEVLVALCVPATLITRAVAASPGFLIGAQDIHHEPKGAFTGSVSAQMVKDAGAKLTIVGHSERRELLGETNAQVRAKAELAIDAGLKTILCVGESLAVRETGQALNFVGDQLDASLPDMVTAPIHLSIAYEPIWAIGTGKVPSAGDIEAMHARIREVLERRYGEGAASIRILYGGSVKGSNAADIFAIDGVDGALVGGASLAPDDFMPIVHAAAAAAKD
ncbi:triose-phosphate isomerase [Sphingomicrobium astaxanthinifaciens]|uniref:triose-phosphate isomerase n=1 Tax=Sphingomicrobium astaxanthinifaciens TaxID=1227949 RepID=UPI001FCC2E12|nr:triose-phosphate isomerase [Sphingomicrobium astaxanthinifaciens]MCJ7422178.1 triose-phosphate isomerase [Sphingomicrobium astaxanthinifaciens]